MDPNIRRMLEEADWKKIVIRLMSYTLRRVKQLGWRQHSRGAILPRGKTIEDIVFDAIAKVWDGQRVWNPKKVPDLLYFLCGVVKSDLGHLAESKDHTHVDRLVESPEEGRDLYNLSRPEPSPEEQVVSSISEGDFQGRILGALGGDRELETIVVCIFTNHAVLPREISKETGISLRRVYKLRERLRGILETELVGSRAF